MPKNKNIHANQLRYIVLLFLLHVSPLRNLQAQVQHHDLRIMMYNVSFGGITGAIGSLINNNKKKEKNLKKAIRGFWQGSVGGGFNYISKKSTFLITRKENIYYSLNSKLLNTIGCSMIENASSGSPFLQNWHLVYGPFRFDFKFTRGAQMWRMRMMPIVIPSIITQAQGTKFDLKTTLVTGAFAFKGDTTYVNRFGMEGSTSQWAFSYASNTRKYNTIAHELIHTFQYHEYLSFNTYFNKLDSVMLLNKCKKIFKKIIYLDIPYFNLAYRIEGFHQPMYYYKNYFEMEAGWCSSNW